MGLELTIVTPSGRAYRGDVDSVVLPGSEGDFGVLPGHERFLTALRTGEVQIRTGNQTVYAASSPGFADVSAEQVTVMVDSCELASEIDVARAELARQRAEQGLAALQVSRSEAKPSDDQRGGDAEAARAAEFEEAIARARNRIAVGQRK